MKKSLVLLAIVFSFISFKPKPVTWTAIGDSITYLNDHTDETGNRITKGYMTLVTEKLRHITCFNQGHNGWTVEEIAEQIDSLGLQKTDVYSIFLGTNDWWHGNRIGSIADYNDNTGAGTIYGSFRIIIDKIRALNPNATIILITPMKRVDFVQIHDFHNNAYGSYREKNGQTLEQIAGAVMAIGSQEHLAVVDLFHMRKLGYKDLVHFKRLKDPHTGEYKKYPYPDFIAIPFHPDTDEYPYPAEAMNMTYDGLHPSDKGYQVIAGKLVKLMKKL